VDLERFQSLLLGSLARLLALVITAIVVLRFLHVSALTGFVVLIAVYVGLSALQVTLRRKQSRRHS
jgi:cadmium resistance protein CadD (predicted permease)